MLTPEQAVTKAKNTATWAAGMCDNFVANMFGFTSSGYNRAIDNWNAVPVASRHLGDTNAPAGALEFWSGGSTGAGHVAISDGAGNIISTDQPTSGKVSTVPQSTISNTWGETYLGWTPPMFQGQMGNVGATTGSGNSSTVTPASDTVSPVSLTSDFLASLLKDTGVGNLGDLLQRLGLVVLGAVFILVGVYRFTDAGKNIPNPVKESVKSRKQGIKTVTHETEMVE